MGRTTGEASLLGTEETAARLTMPELTGVAPLKIMLGLELVALALACALAVCAEAEPLAVDRAGPAPGAS
jgi:hypothetical protein